MSENQKELRRAAAQAFMESLDQLEQRLSITKPVQPVSPSPKAPQAKIDRDIVQDLEEAVADIEQHIHISPLHQNEAS
ncbi:hypothetical protein ACQ4M4_16870 [Leptolyngbya sp. AN02str]|uniref:hypothetical protein n=1 Tax=Leptolyngbya sp. AN02str TaxID=3423363 RepID=UPI003D31FE6B